MVVARRRVDSVLLVDEGWAQTLPLARALELAGLRVTVATANDDTAEFVQRSVRWCCVPRDGDELLAWIARTPYDVIVPLTERLQQRLWMVRGVFPATTARQRELLADKHALIAALAARGFPTLRQEPLSATPGESFPLVVKGATGVGGARVAIVHSPDELARVTARAREIGDAWCVQEWAPGPTFLVGGVFDRGRAVRLYAGEKLEQFPPHTGPAIRLRSTTNTRIRELACDVMQTLGWTGFASIDVIVRRDGEPCVLEVNPRPWGSIGVAAAAGVELYAPFAALLRGETPRADLACADGDDRLVFPRYVLAAKYRGLAGTLRTARELLVGEQAREWRHPRMLVHALRRLHRLSRGSRL